MKIIILKDLFLFQKFENTCLIYDSTDRFYHGYNIMASEGYRKALHFKFSKKNYLLIYLLNSSLKNNLDLKIGMTK